MTQHFQTFYSNRTEILYSHLKDCLFSRTSPLSRRIVIVPSPAMKSWVTLQLAKDPELGIAAGIDIGFVEPSMRKIFQAVALPSSSKGYEPSEMEISLAVETAICQILKSPPPQNEWLPLIQYIGPETLKAKHLPKKTQKRISALAAALAKDFIDYGIYGEKVISTWNTQGPHDWQQLLWQEMESLFGPWNYPARKLGNIAIKKGMNPENLQIHVFGLSYFPPLYVRFLHKIAEHIPVTFYLLSPCQKFWGDLLSPKESLRLKNFWKQKDVTLSSQEALDLYIRDNNPLLANLGKVGREMANRMEECCLETLEQYSLPESILQYDAYNELTTDEIVLEPSNAPLSLLESLQADMALLRNPESAERLQFKFYDASIQVHAAPKKTREVQAIYDIILGIIDKHSNSSNPIHPGDILVMAPNITDYLPFIRSTFNTQANGLDIQLMEPQSPMRFEVVRAFVHLLSLAKGRWEASAFIQLIEFPSFRKKLNIDNEDIITIHKWIKDAKISWGTDDLHRREVMHQDYQKDTSASQKGTWEYGLGRLLEGLVYKPENSSDTMSPLAGIDFSQADLLGSILQVLRSLKDDFKPLTNGSKLTLVDWSAYLTCVLEAYFAPYDQDGNSDGFQLLREHIEAFAKCSTKLKDATFTFDTISRHLENNLRKESSSFKESNLNAVRFSSLLPMRTVPAKVVVLMGMGDGEFPRLGQPRTWNLMANNPQADYFPEAVDFDRYLFLEAILSARKYLIFSHVSQEPGNTKELGPSLLVKEVLNYLDSSCDIHGEKPSASCIFKHPLAPFDARYFSENSPLKCYSHDYYKAALASIDPQKDPAHSFIQRFKPPEKGTQHTDGIKIELAALLSFAKNPFKVFLNSQGIYLDKIEDRILNDDADIFLTELNSWILLREALKGSIDSTLAQAENSGMLPEGSFNPVAKDKLNNEITTIHNNLNEIGVESSQVFSIVFNERHTTPQQRELNWFVPPLIIESTDYGPITIVGKIDFITTRGMLLLVNDELKKSIEIWPSILAFACLVDEYNLPIEKQVIFAKKGNVKRLDIGDPRSLLAKFAEYFLASKDSPSPLSPDQIHQILTDKMREKQSGMDDDSQQHFDPNMRWMEQNSAHADITQDLEHWQSQAKQLFAAMPAQWYPRSVKKDLGLYDDV